MIASKKNWYFVHRWLGLIVGLQLLTWSVSGFVFTILDIDDVHGDLDRRITESAVLRIDRVRLSPAQAQAATTNTACDTDNVCELRLRNRMGRVVYELLDCENKPVCVVDATSGEVQARISPEQAKKIALADVMGKASVASIELIEQDPPGEFGNGLLPAYRVDLNHPKNPHIYISAVTGAVLKRRNRPWRIFDFLWMLHIMDYQNRTDFNHWLLTGMSLLAMLTSASGLALWWWRRPSWLRRRKQSCPLPPSPRK